MVTHIKYSQTPLGRRITRAAAAVAAVVLAIGISGCSGSSDSSAESTPGPTETTSSPSPEDTTGEETTTPEETEAETTKEEITEEETTEEETIEEPTEQKTHELIPGATLLEDAVAELRALKQSELQEIIDNDDVEKLAYFKSILLLDAATFKTGSLYSGDCEVWEIGGGNPLFTDLRKMKSRDLFCATITIDHIALAQDKEYGGHAGSEAPLDRDMAIKSEMIHMGILAKSSFEYRDTLENRRKLINEQTKISVVNVLDDIESAYIVKEGAMRWNDVYYDTITVSYRDNEDIEHHRTFLLVPLPKILDFPGEYTASDYGHLKIDENGIAVTKDNGTPVVIPILVDY